MPPRVDDPRPPYQQLADELRLRIESGEYQPGDKLPSTRQLATEHGLALQTVSSALRVLRDAGVVKSEPGRGVFVRDPSDPAARPSDGRTVDEKLDEAREMLRQAQELLDSIQADAPPAPEPDFAPAADQDLGPDL